MIHRKKSSQYIEEIRKEREKEYEKCSLAVITHYLNKLPKEYASLAISQCNYDLAKDGPCFNLKRAINLFSFWDVTDEGVEFWYAVANAIDGDEVDIDKLPTIPNN